MLYGITVRFDIELETDDENEAYDLVSELAPDELLAMAEGAVNVDVEAM